MFYASRKSDEQFGKPEEGVFFSVAEFAPYRALGWEGTKELNDAADEYLVALGRQELARGEG